MTVQHCRCLCVVWCFFHDDISRRFQKIDDERNDSPNSASDDSSESDSSGEEEDELDAVRPMLKLPIQFDLDDLAGAFLANNNQK